MNKDDDKLLDELLTASSNISTWLEMQVANGSIKGLVDIKRIDSLKTAISAFLAKVERFK